MALGRTLGRTDCSCCFGDVASGIGARRRLTKSLSSWTRRSSIEMSFRACRSSALAFRFWALGGRGPPRRASLSEASGSSYPAGVDRSSLSSPTPLPSSSKSFTGWNTGGIESFQGAGMDEFFLFIR